MSAYEFTEGWLVYDMQDSLLLLQAIVLGQDFPLAAS
jgi:hypothetical protein